MEDPYNGSDLDMAMRLQNGLIAEATGSSYSDHEYSTLRRHFASKADTKDKIPDFVRRCRDLGQFWSWIKYAKGTYQERRELIWAAFQPLLGYLETLDKSPGVAPISDALFAFDPEHVHAVWQKALDRRSSDPDGAITAARTLLESICKHVLDDFGVDYSHDANLPQLWAKASEQLNLAPSQHQEQIFKAILGNCQSVVNSLGAIRNKIGDAHGQGKRPIKPKARHAELAVNLAGTMASFLAATWKERKEG